MIKAQIWYVLLEIKEYQLVKKKNIKVRRQKTSIQIHHYITVN